MAKETVGQFTAFVGKRIAARRKKKKLTQTELATKIGVSSSAYDRMEHGLCNINLEQLMQLAKHLAPTEDLLGLPHYSDEEMADFVNQRVLAMSEEELRDWKQNTEPAETDHRRIFILDSDEEQE